MKSIILFILLWGLMAAFLFFLLRKVCFLSEEEKKFHEISGLVSLFIGFVGFTIWVIL